MKNISITIVCIVLLSIFSCKKEKQIISRKVIQEKIDSVVSIRKQEVDDNARRDLEHRITIEVKVKSDSIYRSKLIKPKKDTLTKIMK